MIPLLNLPDDRGSIMYLLEENALLKDACIRERMRTRGTLLVIEQFLQAAQQKGHTDVIHALESLKTAIDL